MAVVEKFLKDKLEFMKNNVVIASAKGDFAKQGNIAEFTFYYAGQGFLSDGTEVPWYSIVWKDGGSGKLEKDSFSAYWCPYETDKVRWIALADQADFMFTAKMDGCSFGIGIPAADGTVVVAHANTTSGVQDAIGNHLREKGDAQQKQLESAMTKAHTELFDFLAPTSYRPFSANSTIFGIRDGTTGTWTFYFSLCRSNRARLELIGCFPFPHQAYAAKQEKKS